MERWDWRSLTGGDLYPSACIVHEARTLLKIAGHPDQIWSIAFNYDGSRIVTTCKDRMLRIIDAHTGDVLSDGMGHEGVKPQRAIFMNDGRVLSTGFTKRSERLYALRQQVLPI